MPGYTHLQKAQPVSVAQYINAYSEMFLRDLERFTDCYKRTDVMPLGSGALAGTDFPIDRRLTASLLSFSEISQNSIDAVSDRDFVAEYIFCCATVMMHLSRFFGGSHPLLLGRIPLHRDRRLVRDGLFDHAAEEKPPTSPNSCAAKRGGCTAASLRS